MKKIVNLKEYKNQKQMKEWIRELDQLEEEQYKFMSPEEQKGYKNFMRLIHAVDQKSTKDYEKSE